MLALILRLIRLDFQPLWWDEGYSVFFATRDFLTMLARTAVDIHPPLYYALLQLWIPLAGKSDIALRFFSVLVGIATIPLMYILGRDLFGRRSGFIAAFLLTLAPFHIYYSQEVRMYGLVTLLALVSMVLQVRLLRPYNAHHSDRSDKSLSDSKLGFENQIDSAREVFFKTPPLRLGMTNAGRRRLGMWLAYVLITAAALYAHYFAAFIIVAEIVVVLIAWAARARATGRPPLQSWLAAWLATSLLYLPWVIYSGVKLFTYVKGKVGIEQFQSLDPITFIGQHLATFSIGHVTAWPWLGWTTVAFAALALFGIGEFNVQNSKLKIRHFSFIIPQSSFLILVYLFTPLLLGWLVNLVYTFHPIRYERLLLPAAPAFYLLVARGIDALWQRQAVFAWSALALIALVSAASLYDFYSVERYAAEDYRPIVEEMGTLAADGDVVLAPYPWQIGYLQTYYRGPAINIFEVPADAWGSDPSQIEQGLSTLRSQSARVWLLAYQTKGRRLEDQLANFYSDDYRLWDNWYGNSRLEYFGQAADPPMTGEAVDYLPELQLASFGASARTIPAGGGFVTVRLHWNTKSSAYSYSLRLTGANGDKKSQQDGPVPSGNEIQRLGIVPQRTLSPGVYEVRLVVYRSADGQPIPLSTGEPDVILSHVSVTDPN